MKTRKGPKFIYQLQYCPNPDCIQIITRNRFPENPGVGMDLRFTLKHHKDKIHPFYKDLARIRGLKDASNCLDVHTLLVTKSNELFRWEEVIPRLLKAIQKHIAKDCEMVEAAPAKRPSAMELMSLRGPLVFGDS